MRYYTLVFLMMMCSFYSCLTASYQTSYNSTTYGVDYREGKWLLNTIEAPLTVKDRMEELASKHFKDKLGTNFRDANTDQSIALSYIPLNPDSLTLKRLKKESKSDYIINIKGDAIRNDLGGSKVGITYSSKSNVAKTTLQIYDLNTLEIIYDKTISGSVSINQHDSKEFNFVKGANGIVVSCLKKILRKMD